MHRYQTSRLAASVAGSTNAPYSSLSAAHACYTCAACLPAVLPAVPAEVQPLQVRADTSSLTTGMRNGSSFFVTQFALPLLVRPGRAGLEVLSVVA